jgi:hypothetical protein
MCWAGPVRIKLPACMYIKLALSIAHVTDSNHHRTNMQMTPPPPGWHLQQPCSICASVHACYNHMCTNIHMK